MGNYHSSLFTKYIEIYAPECSRARKRDGYARRCNVVAEKALGKPLPPKSQIHHFDENKRNDSNTNLVICEDESYHRLLHKRKRILDKGGNPNNDFICNKCDSIKSKYNFYTSKSSSSGYQSWCKNCLIITNSKNQNFI